jgi:hypothetical protein
MIVRSSRRSAGALVLAAALVAGCQREQANTALAVPPAAPASPAQASLQPPHASPDAAEIQAIEPPAHAVETLAPATAACLAHSAQGSAPGAAVHRWVDAKGITHYSDQAPPADAKDARVIDVHGVPAITVEARGYDVNLPDQLQQRAVADALGVQRVMHDALGVAAPQGLTLHVVFVKAPDAYARLIGDPALAESAGAYSTAQQTIFVRMQAQDEASFAVLRHEITHALVHESIGNLPTSINEGLAEYFGRYRIGGLGGQIDVGADRKAVVAAAPEGDGGDALVDLLARDGRNFYVLQGDASGRERRYLQAYALVAMLMNSVEGRSTLGGLLKSQQADPCRPIASETVLDQRFPGGLQAVAAGWTAFMRSPPDTVQAY